MKEAGAERSVWSPPTKGRIGKPCLGKRKKYCPQPSACTAPLRGPCPCQFGPGSKDLFPGEYYAWTNMKTRCTNPKTFGWERYGGRGISVCKAWLDSFDVFLADVGRKPFKEAILDRIDFNGNYEPGNVRWVNIIESARNKERVRPVTVNGVTLLLPEWQERVGTDRKIIWRRLQQGWPAELAIYGGPMPYRFRGKPNNIELYWREYLRERAGKEAA